MDFLERFLHISPDGHTGAAEFFYILVLVLIVALLYPLYRHRYTSRLAVLREQHFRACCYQGSITTSRRHTAFETHHNSE